MKKVISAQDIKRLRSFDSPTIANAVEFFQVRDNTVGYASMALKCLTPELPPMVGYAATATVDTTTPGRVPPGFGKLQEFLDLVSVSPRRLVKNPLLLIMSFI